MTLGPGPLLGVKECFFEKCIYASTRYETSFCFSQRVNSVINTHTGEQVSQASSADGVL